MDALATLAAAGFDIAHAFDAAAAAREPGLELLAAGPRLGILIGNTRALWPPFSAALRTPELAADPDPLERYTEQTIDAVFGAGFDAASGKKISAAWGAAPGAASAAAWGAASGAASARPRVLYGHRRYGGAFLPLQRLAVATGLGVLAPTQLVIHPTYGPWFALRAVALVDGDPPARAPIASPCRCDASCLDAFARAQRSADWRDWLAVRERCSLQSWRYSEEQIRFHYVNGLAARSRR